MANRYYRAGVLPALVALSQGRCYWPDCKVRILEPVEGEPTLNVEIAHVVGLNEDSARHEDGHSDEWLNSYENLLLLCPKHHKTIDGHRREDYSTAKLRGWKRERERGGLDALASLGTLTEEELQNHLLDAFDSVVDRVEQALDRFAKVDRESADVLRALIAQLTDVSAAADFPSSTTAEALLLASSGLQGLSETSERLAGAAQTLKTLNLLDVANALNAAASRAPRYQGVGKVAVSRR